MGTTDRPRLVIFRSLRHIFAQVVDDSANKVLVAASDLAGKKSGAAPADGKKSERARAVGKRVAELCKAKGIEKVVFDRAGYLYHGRVAQVAEGAREGGLQF